MSKILFLILFLCQGIYIISKIDISNSFEDGEIKVDPGFSQTYFINYEKNTKFTFNIAEEDSLYINIHSINCNFKLDFDGKLFNQINLNTYSLEINSANNNITLTPLFDVIDGIYKENYEKKTCALSINSFSTKDKQPELKIGNKEENIFHFEPDKYNSLNLLYKINEISHDSFIALHFLFNEKSHFSINVTFESNDNRNNSRDNIYIDNSTYIYLDSQFLLYENSRINNNPSGGNIYIKIINKDNKAINMNFKIIEKDTISILEKDALNFGFLTSKTTYQYYYTEVFKGEEGEIMLHNKRIYGILHAKIVSKNEIKPEQLNDISIYPKEESLNETNTTHLNYNPHSLKLNYSYEDTIPCFNGCYILITYEQKKSEEDNYPLIGYEFTLLSRTWNYTDYISQIIDIPFNEYIIGNFDGSATNHYYSIFVPNDAEKIFIQIEGNYIDGFYEEGRTKISTIKVKKETRSLNIINNKYMLTLDIKQLNFNNKIISFAFRPKDYFTQVYSFYYFRVLYTQKNEKLILPIDSHFGNLCLPEKENNGSDDSYYCHLIFKNNYNLLSTKFSISSSIQNEYFEIHVTKVYPGGKIINEMQKIIYYKDNVSEDIDYYLFKFLFRNNEIKNIITSFCDNVKEMYPQIYSPQMVYLDNSTKINYFKLKNNYTLNYKYVFGTPFNQNFMKYSFRYLKNIASSRNFRGKPIALQIGPNIDNITYWTKNNQSIYFFQLMYNMRNKGIEEIKSGDAVSQIMVGGHFPLYYYLKIKSESYINVDVNFRLNSYDDSVLKNNFTIKGYMVDEATIKRKINGELIQYEDPISGYYSDVYKIGLLQVNRNYSDKNYLLIEIMNTDQVYIDSDLLVELVTKEYNPLPYVLPVNQYIIESFDGENNTIRGENKYYLSSTLKDSDQAFIEISPAYSDIDIKFNESQHIELRDHDVYNGFKKYWVNYSDNYDVYFSVINPNHRNTSYMMRYFFTGRGGENVFDFNKNYQKEITDSKISDDFVTVTLTFKGILIYEKGTTISNETNVYFSIFGYLYHLNTSSNENINTTSELIEQKYLYESKTLTHYNSSHPNDWKLTFENISRNNNYIYDLQFQMSVIYENKIFDEEFIIYTTKLDLTDIKKKEPANVWLIVGIILGVIAVFLITFFIIKYIRLQKRNTNLKEEMKSMAYSNNIQKNVLIKEQQKTKKETDYETTFI